MSNDNYTFYKKKAKRNISFVVVYFLLPDRCTAIGACVRRTRCVYECICSCFPKINKQCARRFVTKLTLTLNRN